LEVIKFDVTKVTMATEAEVARVRAAWIAAGPMNPERLADAKAERERPALLNLIAAWDALSLDERSAVSLELARQLPGSDALDLDVGAAAFSAAFRDRMDSLQEPDDLEAGPAAWFPKRKRGVREPGFREAVQEAGKVWMERDAAHTWNPGNIHRDDSHYALTEGWQPSPMLAFVAFTVTRALPVAALRRAANVKQVRWVDALRAAHTQLRA
jgi:hypothetical protein